MKITGNCYAVLGLGYIPPWTVNSGIVVGEEKTLVIDTGPNAFVAETIYGYAKAIKPLNNIIALNCEKHFDHIGGNSLFEEKGVEIWGHYKIERKPEDLLSEVGEYHETTPFGKRKEHREAEIIYKNTRVVNPKIKIYQEQTIHIGGLAIEILFTPGHTETNISVFVPEQRVLYCADALIEGYLPNLKAGTKENWKVWLTSLDKIEALKPKYVLPGHGTLLEGNKINEALDRLRGILTNSIETGQVPTF